MALLPAQGARVLSDIERRFHRWRSHRDISGIAEAERVLLQLHSLEDSEPAIREKACAFLKEVVVSPVTAAEVFRWRVTAVALIGALAEERVWCEFLVKVARSRRSELRGLELWVERALGKLRGAKPLRHLLRLVQEDDVDLLVLALGGLARMEDPAQGLRMAAALPRLLELAGHDDTEVRSRAVGALGRIDGEEARAAVIAATRDGQDVVRLAGARALGYRKVHPAVTETLATLLSDRRALIREEAAIGLRRHGSKALAPRLIARLAIEPLRQRVALWRTLRKLCGVDHPPEHGPWKAWWDRFGSRGQTGPPVPDSKYDRPSYYDVPIESDRLLFIIDTSMSMGYALHENTKSESRLVGAKRELVRVIRVLDGRSKMNIMPFSSGVSWWSKSLVRARPAARKAAVSFVRRLGHAGKTNSYGVLLEAFDRFPEVDTIFFVSDGIPTVGKTVIQERILQRVAEWNRLRDVRIHTIAAIPGDLDPAPGTYTPQHDAMRFMRILARETGGTFTRVH